ncbi:hypothetical protein CABS03_10835 [Colletotrichum abscissum]|uniref:Anaphase-promoting complex subunit 4-like WD40 domain-containing protein n=1 Tax=Colletotrichum abscissum TaxID=1671311 RepID=A0A9P9XQ73_9PEZI|nr:hypothetical protein CABS02_02056 [Colletotrichum abscissum]
MWHSSVTNEIPAVVSRDPSKDCKSPSRRHDIDGIWQKQIRSTAFFVSFNANDSKVFVTLKGNVKQAVLTFSTRDGEQLDSLCIIEDRSDSDSDDNHESLDRFCPEVVRFSPVLGYAAVTYRSSHLTLFDLNEEDKLERLFRIEKRGSEKLRPPQILDVVFNPAIESGLMAVAYQDGDIIVIHFDEDRWYQVGSVSLHSRVLASSPDGMILAAGDTEGGVSLFNFDSLQLLHRLELLEETVVGIIFSSNTLRLYDVRGRSCNVWEPSVLLRQNATDDTSSDQDGIPDESNLQRSVTRPFDEAKFVTVLTSMGDDKHVFCGREDGSVSVHDVKDGQKIVEFKHHSASIRVVEWNPKVNLLRGEELWQNKTPPEPFSPSQLSTESGQWMQHPTDKSPLLLLEQSTHLFIPSFWRTGDLLIRTVSKDSMAIAYRDEIIIFQGFLDFDKKVEWQ